MITVTTEIGGNGPFRRGPRRKLTKQVRDDRNLGTPGKFVYVRFIDGNGRTQRDRRNGAKLWLVAR